MEIKGFGKETTVFLRDPLILEGASHKKILLREATEEDVQLAVSRSQKLVEVPDSGLWSLTSPTLMTFNMLLQQIVSIGDIQGPFSMEDIKKLSGYDLLELCRAAANINKTIH